MSNEASRRNSTSPPIIAECHMPRADSCGAFSVYASSDRHSPDWAPAIRHIHMLRLTDSECCNRSTTYPKKTRSTGCVPWASLYAETAAKQKDRTLAAAYNDRAGELLAPLAELGLRDSRLEYVLALVSSGKNLRQAIQHVEKALEYTDLPMHLRCDGMQVLAKARNAGGRHEEAVAMLRQLTRLRRNASDWLLLAQFERARGNQAGAVEASEAAVRINTWLPDVHRSLMQTSLQQGNRERANWHRARVGVP